MTKRKPIFWLFFTLLLFVAASCNPRLPRELIVGGDNVVMILDFENSSDSVKQVIWQLNTFEIPNMPDTMIRRMKMCIRDRLGVVLGDGHYFLFE